MIWGLAFLLPVLLPGWNAVTVTAGRYVASGAVSTAMFVAGGAALRRVAREHWRNAVLFAITGSVGYYLLLVVGIRTIGAPVTDMVIGSIPLTAGLLINVETASGFAYVYAARHQWPPAGQLVGFALVMAGMVLAMYRQLAPEVFLPDRPRVPVPVGRRGA